MSSRPGLKCRLPSLSASCLVAAALVSASCDWLQDRFKSCRDVRVDLVNSQQTLGPYFIVGPDESFDSANRLESGASRSLAQCLEKGDRKKFRAGNLAGDTIGLVTCVAGRSSYEGQPVPQVVWFNSGFECQEW